MEYKEKELKRIQNSSNFLAHLFHVRPSSAIFRRRHRQFGATASSQEPERLTSILVISMSPTMTKFGLPDETLSREDRRIRSRGTRSLVAHYCSL